MNKEIEKIVLTGLFIAIGVVLAPLFHSAGLGQVFSPMHFPVLVCGLLLGWKYGLITGLLTPLITSFMLQAPPLFPMATVMSLELAVYGLLSGLIYNKCSLFTSKIANVYVALIVAMIAGRIVYGLTYGILFVLGLSDFAFSTYVTSLFVVGLPGIVLQILIVPAVVMTIERKKAFEE